MRYEESRSSQDAWRRSPRSIEICRRWSRRLPKQKKPGHVYSESFVSQTMPLGINMRWYPAEVAVTTIFRRDDRLSPALRNDALRTGILTEDTFLRSAFGVKKHRANILSTVQNVKVLTKMVWTPGAYHHGKEQGPVAGAKGSAGERRCRRTSMG